ncbi:hypothetical protein HPB48_018450 [Haemaphysalis longicornis]|uniref:THAP-type domain-containing protein n=1 Tax=Haemaphysalis longicornis TaxID=44386 RepID=A0A9J6GAN3_HAELO|nr:hypothetical protein HPB48_018450 [Haemaphysalis longicornis]
MEKRPKLQTHCFAPGCKSGYVSARKKGTKAYTFAAPSDEERFKVWQRVIPRADKPLEKTSVLCELRFEQRFIERNYTHVVNGEVVKIPCGRPCLTEDAVPTLFPNAPTYLSKRLPEKRQSRTSRGEVLGKRMKGNDGAPCAATVYGPDSTDETGATDDPIVLHDACTMENLDHLKGEKLPSASWSRNFLAEAQKTLAFSVCALAGDSVCFRKLVLCSAEGTRYHCSVYVQGATVKKVDVPDTEAVENLLRSVDQMCVCPGFEQSLAPSEQR